MNIELLRGISKSDYAKNLVVYLRQLENHVADIRNGDFSNETRKQTIDVIEELLVRKIISMSDDRIGEDENYR